MIKKWVLENSPILIVAGIGVILASLGRIEWLLRQILAEFRKGKPSS